MFFPPPSMLYHASSGYVLFSARDEIRNLHTSTWLFEGEKREYMDLKNVGVYMNAAEFDFYHYQCYGITSSTWLV